MFGLGSTQKGSLKCGTNQWLQVLVIQAGPAVPDSGGDGSVTHLCGEPSTAGT